MTLMSFPSMRLRALGCVAFSAALAVCLPVAVGSQGEQPISPHELGQIWDAEHVSPPLPPLVDHQEVVRRLTAVVSGAPDLFTLEKIGESIEGRSINYVRAGTGPLERVVVVADARRRVHGHVSAVRSVRLPSPSSSGSRRRRGCCRA